MKNFRLLASLFLIGLLTSSWSQAKTFRNAYVSFELPPNWKCHLEQTEWICRSQNQQQSREAIIIITAKEEGPSDSLNSYMRHLKTPRLVTNRSGQNTQSKIFHAKEYKINNQPWVDGWHLGSELPPYYTRYLATIKSKIAILVTFSAHKKYYTRYSKDFFNAIKSLRVIASKGLINRPNVNIRPGSEKIGQPITNLMGDMMGEDDIEENLGSSSEDDSSLIFALAFLLIAVGGYIFYKKKRG